MGHDLQFMYYLLYPDKFELNGKFEVNDRSIKVNDLIICRWWLNVEEQKDIYLYSHIFQRLERGESEE